ncbi:ammonium transporter, partial [bacterium]|nr:ammonium transporter [bacterium]
VAGFVSSSTARSGYVSVAWHAAAGHRRLCRFTVVCSAILFFVIGKTMGLRPIEEAEREGLDLSSHGERAYNY